MGNVMVIPAKRQVGSTVRQQDVKPKLRVAAYCRVSTDSDEQATSYEAQVEHYTDYIQKNPEWEFAGIFADDGISGTNTKKREEFNRMIGECMSGQIDMIITKSISRFARNTLDCLKYIRQLKEKNIPVFFEKESINTMDAKGEVLITIMASLAQQESQSLSQNVKLGLQFRYQNGQVQVNHNRFLGYTKDAEGHLIIDPAQAEVVKRIYREYLEGYSMDKIAAGLERDGILTGAGKTKWWTSTINKILRNEKYIGDALLQKTYTTDFLNKTRVKNNGIVPQYYVEADQECCPYINTMNPLRKPVNWAFLGCERLHTPLISPASDGEKGRISSFADTGFAPLLIITMFKTAPCWHENVLAWSCFFVLSTVPGPLCINGRTSDLSHTGLYFPARKSDV